MDPQRLSKENILFTSKIHLTNHFFRLISPSEEVAYTKYATYSNDENSDFVNVSDMIELPKDQAGGNYKLRVSFEFFEHFACAERMIQVKVYNEPPKLNLQLEFVKKGLGNLFFNFVLKFLNFFK